MSAANPNPSPNNRGVIGITFLKYVLLALVIVGGAMVGYYIGAILGTMLGSSQIYEGYAFGGLYQLYYNATHVSQYGQLASIAPGLGITDASVIKQGFAVIGLVMGLIGGIIGGIMVYKKIDEYAE